MSDLIDRKELLDFLYELEKGSKTDDAEMAVKELIGYVASMPPAEPHTFRVIDTKTKEEADTYEIALKEEWAKGLCYCDIDMFVIGEDGTLMLIDDCGKCAYCPEGRFEVEWDG